MGLLDFNSNSDPNDNFHAVDSFACKNNAANLAINADKTRKLIIESFGPNRLLRFEPQLDS
mgnify:CR=1 FL=1